MSERHSVHDSSARKPPRQRAGLVLLCSAQLMLVLDLTVVNIALPSMAVDLGLSGVQATGVVTAYVVAFGGLMLAGGRLADLHGRRHVLAWGIAVFTAASLVCGLAVNAEMLLAGRIAQGVSGRGWGPSASSPA
jgi:MFS family permease